MKRFITLLLTGLLLCSCRPIDQEKTPDNSTDAQTDSPVSITVEYETDPIIDRTNDGKTIVLLDAGHGFDDVGCGPCYMGCYENEVTISVVKKLKESLEALGAEVILTHDGESYPDEAELIASCKKHNIEYKEDGIIENNIFSAYERAIYEEILIIEKNIDFFISLHVNSVEHADYVDGYELYYCEDNPHTNEIINFGSRLGDVLDNDLLVDGTEYDDSYIVTKYADIPSVLFEMGYATNPQDAKKLTDEAWQKKLADILAAEITAFIENQGDKA